MRLKVEFEIEIPSTKDVSEDEVLAWVEFNLIGGVLESTHPLAEEDFEIDPFSVACEELHDDLKKVIPERSKT